MADPSEVGQRLAGDAPAAPEPKPWWYSPRPRFTVVLGLAVVCLGLLRTFAGDLTPVAGLLALCGVFQVVVGVKSMRYDALR